MLCTGSPAEKAGLHEGQVLVSVNGISVLESEHDDIVNLVQQGKLHVYVINLQPNLSYFSLYQFISAYGLWLI